MSMSVAAILDITPKAQTRPEVRAFAKFFVPRYREMIQ